jgi:hypothetical protein
MSGRRATIVGGLQTEPIPVHQEPLRPYPPYDNDGDKQYEHQQSIVSLNTLIDVVLSVKTLLELCVRLENMGLSARIGEIKPF